MVNENSLENLKKRKKFDKDYQPTPEAKSGGRRRINGFKDALEFFGNQLKEMKTLEDGTEVDLSFEANIGYQLMKKANEGDLKAIEIMAKLNGWEAPKKTAFTDTEGKDRSLPISGFIIEE